MTTNYKTIAVQHTPPVPAIELARPPLNIIDIALLGEISEALTRADAAASVRFLIFPAAGEQAFCAGASRHDHLPATMEQMIVAFHKIFRQLAQTDKIVIASVQGHC